MPIIDVSQKTYRSLVRAAHSRGMSIDRFIQQTFQEGSPEIESDQQESPVPGIKVLSAPFHLLASGQAPHAETTPAQVTTGIEPHSSFDALWGRIEQSAGKAISTKRGQEFTYAVKSGYLTVIAANNNGARIPRSQFKKALSQWPQSGPSTMRGIYAASVVWAVLADEQILARAA